VVFWFGVTAVVGFVLGVAISRRYAAGPPARITFYPRQQTGNDLRRRLFGGRG
jgi:hypothetical protein